jgi:hypothetical protein
MVAKSKSKHRREMVLAGCANILLFSPYITSKPQHDEYFAKTFRAVGQLMHLMHDSSVPEHTRNDAHVFYNYETYVENARVGQPSLWRRWINGSTPFDKTILDMSAVPSAPVPISRIIDTDRYTGTNPDITLESRIGLAEYTNANFLSRDTLFTDDLDSDDGRYFQYPKGLNAVLWTDSSNNRQYLKKAGDGESINHLAVTSILYNDRLKYFPQYNSALPVGLDDKCYDEYASKLIPRAVVYSAGLLNYFFRGEIEVVNPAEMKDASGNTTGAKFKVKNNTPDEAMGTGIFVISYQYKPSGSDDFVYGLSSETQLNTSIGFGSESASEFTFNFSSPIPSDAQETKYLLVYRGKLGNEEDAVVGRVIDLTSGMFIFLASSPNSYAVWKFNPDDGTMEPSSFAINEKISFPQYSLASLIVKSNSAFNSHIVVSRDGWSPGYMPIGWTYSDGDIDHYDNTEWNTEKCSGRNPFSIWGGEVYKYFKMAYRPSTYRYFIQYTNADGTQSQPDLPLSDSCFGILDTDKHFYMKTEYRPWSVTYVSPALELPSCDDPESTFIYYNLWSHFNEKGIYRALYFGDHLLDEGYSGAESFYAYDFTSPGCQKRIGITCIGAHLLINQSYDEKRISYAMLDYDHIRLPDTDPDSIFVVGVKRSGSIRTSQTQYEATWDGGEHPFLSYGTVTDGDDYILFYKTKNGPVQQVLLSQNYTSYANYMNTWDPIYDERSSCPNEVWTYDYDNRHHTDFNNAPDREIVKEFSSKVSGNYILYTYILTNQSGTFIKRLIGLINIETGTRAVNEVTDGYLGMHIAHFDKTGAAAIGLHIQ